MSAFDRFQDTEQVRVPGADMAMAQADQEQAELHGQLAKEGFGFTKDILNNVAAKKGAQDALQQGTNFKPALGLTDAGKIYNAAAAPVEQSMLASQVQTHVNQLFEQEMNSPASSDNLAHFSAKLKGYYSGLVNTVPDEYKPYVNKLYNTASTVYGSRIAEKVAAYHQSQNTETLKLKADQLFNNASAQAAEAAANPDPKLSAAGLQSSVDLLHQGMSLQNTLQGNLNSDPAAALVANRNAQSQLWEGVIFGRMQGFIQQYNAATNPQDKLKMAMLIKQYAANPYEADSSVSKKALGFFTESQRMALASHLNAMANSLFKGRHADHSLIQHQMDNALVLARTGVKSSDILQQVAVMYPKHYLSFKTKYDAGLASSAVVKNISNMSMGDAKETFESYSQPGYLVPIPGADPATRAQATSYVLSALRTNFRLAQKDPANWALQSASMQQKLKDNLNSLTSQSTDPDATQKLQTSAAALVSNPFSLSQTILSPEMQKFYTTHLNTVRSEESAQGISPQNQVAWTKTQASNIVKQLNTMRGGDRVKALKIMESNLGANWIFAQRSLLQAKLSPSDIIATAISNNPQYSSTSDDMLDAADSSNPKENPNFYKNVGVTSGKAYTDTASLPAVQSAIASFPNLQGQGGEMASALVSTIARTAAWRMQYQGAGSWKNNTDILTNTATDVLQGMYQNGASNNIRIPYFVSVEGKNGTSTRLPVDMTTVHLAQTYFNTTRNIERYADLSTVSSALEKDRPQDNEFTELAERRRAQRINEIQTGKWVTNPNGTGLNRVDRFGNQVYLKPKKGDTKRYPFQINFINIMHHPPADFLDYQKMERNPEGYGASLAEETWNKISHDVLSGMKGDTP